MVKASKQSNMETNGDYWEDLLKQTKQEKAPAYFETHFYARLENELNQDKRQVKLTQFAFLATFLIIVGMQVFLLSRPTETNFEAVSDEYGLIETNSIYE